MHCCIICSAFVFESIHRNSYYRYTGTGRSRLAQGLEESCDSPVLLPRTGIGYVNGGTVGVPLLFGLFPQLVVCQAGDRVSARAASARIAGGVGHHLGRGTGSSRPTNGEQHAMSAPRSTMLKIIILGSSK